MAIAGYHVAKFTSFARFSSKPSPPPPSSFKVPLCFSVDPRINFTHINASRAKTRRPFSSQAMSDSSTSSSRSQLEDMVKSTVSENPVVVYSKTWCSYSSEVKGLFKRLGVEPLVVELDELGSQGPQLQNVLERLTGQHTVPNVFIGGKHIGGCTDTMELYSEGELEPLLSEANAKKA